jgi:hypothetical protein
MKEKKKGNGLKCIYGKKKKNKEKKQKRCNRSLVRC